MPTPNQAAPGPLALLTAISVVAGEERVSLTPSTVIIAFTKKDSNLAYAMKQSTGSVVEPSGLDLAGREPVLFKLTVLKKERVGLIETRDVETKPLAKDRLEVQR